MKIALGIKTSEFWGAAVAWLVSTVLLVLSNVGLISPAAAEKLDGPAAVSTVLLPVAYALLRTVLKAVELWVDSKAPGSTFSVMASTAAGQDTSGIAVAAASLNLMPTKPSASTAAPASLVVPLQVEPNLVPPESVLVPA